MADTTSETYDLYIFSGNAEDALSRCNADKESIKHLQKSRP